VAAVEVEGHYDPERTLPKAILPPHLPPRPPPPDLIPPLVVGTFFAFLDNILSIYVFVSVEPYTRSFFP
jgi:hypothetical protein